jgi:ActR/RegA family two-component response regulator
MSKYGQRCTLCRIFTILLDGVFGYCPTKRPQNRPISEVLSALTDDGLQPCPHCVGSPVRAETCIMIQRSWEETGHNVSLVARRLGVSRNTVYKHVKSFQ